MGEIAMEYPGSSADRIYHLRRAGHSFSDISLLVGMPAAEAVQAYRTYMMRLASEFSFEDRSMHITMELARLDELQTAIWPDAVDNKDLRAVDGILRIMSHRMKLLGLEKITPTEENVSRIMLVTGTQKEFIEALKAGRSQHEQINQVDVLTGELVDDKGEEV